MRTLAQRGSWAYMEAKAKQDYGEVGVAMVNLLRATRARSKAKQVELIQKAGYSVAGLLEWACRPYSLCGLAKAAQAEYDRLSNEDAE